MLSDIESRLLEVAELSEKRKEAVDQLKQCESRAMQGMKDTFALANKLYPAVFSELTWVQYTPYFMDGDPCEFGVHELNVIGVDDGIMSNWRKIKEIDGAQAMNNLESLASFDLNEEHSFTEPCSYDGDCLSEYLCKIKALDSSLISKTSSEIINLYDLIKSYWNLIGSSFLENTYGDHKRVTFIVVNGILVEKVNGYSHD